MELRIQENCAGIDWTLIRETLKEAGMAYHDPDMHERAFRSSFAVVFIFHNDRMIAFGRALSDGAYQAAIYDVVVIPQYQAKGVGKILMDRLILKIAPCNIILYANPGKEGFYVTLGFSSLKTGMGKFLNPQRMKNKGMI